MTTLTRKTISGKARRYADWRKQVVAIVEERNLPDTIRNQVTEPMMIAGWKQGDRPDYFVQTVVEYFSF